MLSPETLQLARQLQKTYQEVIRPLEAQLEAMAPQLEMAVSTAATIADEQLAFLQSPEVLKTIDEVLASAEQRQALETFAASFPPSALAQREIFPLREVDPLEFDDRGAPPPTPMRRIGFASWPEE